MVRIHLGAPKGLIMIFVHKTRIKCDQCGREFDISLRWTHGISLGQFRETVFLDRATVPEHKCDVQAPVDTQDV